MAASPKELTHLEPAAIDDQPALGQPHRGIALHVVPALLAAFVLGAHFLRTTEVGLALAAAIGVPALLLVKRRWALRLAQLFLAAGAVEWVRTTLVLVSQRQELSMPWARLALILGAVAAGTLGASLLLGANPMLRRYPVRGSTPVSLGAALLALAVLVPAQVVMERPALLVERFLPTFGWLELLALSVYAGWLAEQMIDPATSAVWRRRLWRAFSVVFFAQLLVGLLGVERFLMTGRLHLPIPALIVAGPLFRGEGFFMPILLGVTLLLVGPAWCSHLCYIGAWDDLAATGLSAGGTSGRTRRPSPLPWWRRRLQWVILGLVVASALGLRALGVPGGTAVMVTAAYGLGGVAVMVLWSRRKGAMTHCVSYCPIGIVTTVLGRVNPFRLRIGTDCTSCGACSRPCRYDALKPEDIARRRPGSSCTLCGDCVGRCPDGQMRYWLPGVSPFAARAAFITLVVGLHTAFLGVARI